MGVTLPLPQEGEELTGPATEKLASWNMNLACSACISAMHSTTHQALGYRKGQNRRSSIIFGLPNTGLILLSEPQDQGQKVEENLHAVLVPFYATSFYILVRSTIPVTSGVMNSLSSL